MSKFDEYLTYIKEHEYSDASIIDAFECFANKKKPKSKKVKNQDSILDHYLLITEDITGVNRYDICSNVRTDDLVLARIVYSILCYKERNKITLTAVARYINRSHSSLVHYRKNLYIKQNRKKEVDVFLEKYKAIYDPDFIIK